MVAEAVDSASVPVRGVEFTTKSPAASETTLTLMMVPSGMLRASSATGIGEAVLTVTSAILLTPIGVGGTATPFTVTNRRVGTLAGRGIWYGPPSDAAGVEVPVKLCVKASSRMRPTEAVG